MFLRTLFGSWLMPLLSGIFGFGDDLPSVATAQGMLKSQHYARTDSGNAELFASVYGESVRFDHKRERWLLWDDTQKRWREDKQNQVRSLMKLAARYRRKHALTVEDEEHRESKWAVGSENRYRIDSALELAKSDLPVSDDGEQWDADPWLF